MKAYFLPLIGLALLAGNSARGQAPVPPPAPLSAGPAGAPVVMVMPAASGCCAGQTGCCASQTGCCAGQTTCVPEQYTKKTTTFVYSSGCEPLCLCAFHCMFRKGDCCDSGHCEHPYTRRYLVKKAQVCEQCATRCVPSQASCCTSGCCGATTGCGGSASPVMVAPAMTPPTPMPSGNVVPVVPVQPRR
jgi:hypothetical protein